MTDEEYEDVLEEGAELLAEEAEKKKLQKRIEDLEGAGRELLLESLNNYVLQPNSHRKTASEYYADEIVMFKLDNKEGGGE